MALHGFRRPEKDFVMSSDIAIKVEDLSKCYQIYDQPSDRLKQYLLPRVQHLIGFRRKKYYHDFWAIKDVSFEIKRGETVGIIGRNGSGKSTLLQLICGTLNPTNGSIQTNGRIAALLELGSGFNPEFTGEENVYLNAAVLGLSKEEIDSRYQKIIDFASIGEFINQPVKTYSSGMMVRLAFAVIAHVDADILIVDEALAVGDAFFTQKCMRFINEFKKNKTLLFVSHDINAVTTLCNRTIWLENGQLKILGDTLKVINEYHKTIIESIKKESFTTESNNFTENKIFEGNTFAGKKNSWEEDILINNQINPNRIASGTGNADIVAACLKVEDNSKHIFHGGEHVKLYFLVDIKEDLNGLLVGFTLKDNLGKKIIEENIEDFLRNKLLKIDKNTKLGAELTFEMPLLREGHYILDLAIAEGTQENHVQQQWIYDAIKIDFIPRKKINSIFQVGIRDFHYWTKESVNATS